MKAFVVAVACYFLCLQFVFPGYFQPLTPHHNDFYFPPGLSYDGHSVLEKLTWPRPLGFLALQLLGKLGLHGYLFVIAAIAVANAGLMILLVGRILGRRVSMLASLTYCILLFAHSEFYMDYLHDAMATLSCCYLLLALLAWMEFRDSGRKRFAAAALCLMFLLALTKETYFITAVCLWAVMSFLSKGPVRRAGLGITVASIILFAGALAANVYSLKNVVQLQTGAAEPYHLVLTPISIVQGFRFYAFYLFPMIAAVALLISFLIIFWKERNQWPVAAAFLVAGAAALLPHAALPNHVDTMYAWTGAVFAFAPILFVPFLGVPRVNAAAVQFAAASLLLTGYVRLNAPRYAAHEWTITQERINRNLIASYSTIKQLAASSHKILITGLGMPFHPFRTPSYVRAEFGPDKQWAVIVPRGEKPSSETPVRFVTLSSANPADYDFSFGFDDDGFLISERTKEQLQTASTGEPRDRVLMPSLNLIFNRKGNWEAEWLPLLRAGQIYWQWGDIDSALHRLQQSAEADGNKNPYPFFFMGQIREEQGDKAEAARLYEQAVSLDGKRPNPVFTAALARVKSK